MNIPIVFEDDWLMVVNKPAGLLSVPAPGHARRTLTGILNQETKERGLKYQLYPCHRLDRETSGLLVYAKSRSVEAKMGEAFKKRLVHKKYTAFVQGRLTSCAGQITRSIEGKSALTRYRVLAVHNDYSVVEVFPLTGRTNQIRIHFKYLHHPLVGEDRFAFRKDFALRSKRLCLHAGFLEFKHPVTSRTVKLEADLPEDLQKFLQEH